MADQLSITASEVAVVEEIEANTKPTAADVTAGETVYEDSNGKWALADHDAGTGVDGVATHDADSGMPLKALIKGLLDVGDALSSDDYGASLYLSSTAGGIDDAQTDDEEAIGNVTSKWVGTTADKLLRVDL
jgi:hypothetical protein